MPDFLQMAAAPSLPAERNRIFCTGNILATDGAKYDISTCKAVTTAGERKVDNAAQSRNGTLVPFRRFSFKSRKSTTSAQSSTNLLAPATEKISSPLYRADIGFLGAGRPFIW